MNIQEGGTLVLVAVAVIALVWALFGRSGDRPSIGLLWSREGGRDRLPGVFKLVWTIAVAYEDTLGKSLADRFPKRQAKIDELILAADLPLNAARVFSASVFLGLLLLFLGLVVSTLAFPLVPSEWRLPLVVIVPCVLALIGWYWPTNNLQVFAETRQERLTRELPFAIDLVAAAMRSGLDFGAALRYYVNCGVDGPLRDEFERVLTQVRVEGLSSALTAMANRVGLPAFTSFADAVAYGQDVGAPIAQTLKVHGAELRRERFALAERKAARAPQFMILPLACFIMPAVLIVIGTPLALQFMKIRGH